MTDYSLRELVILLVIAFILALIPKSSPPPVDKPSRCVEYRVQPGDTLSEIADRMGSKVSWIQRESGIGDAIIAGESIAVPVK